MTRLGDELADLALGLATRSWRLLHAIDPDVRRLGIGGIVPTVSGPDSIAELEHWALSFVGNHGVVSPKTLR